MFIILRIYLVKIFNKDFFLKKIKTLFDVKNSKNKLLG